MTNEISILLLALSAIESGHNDLKIGANREVSRYQIMPSTWKEWAPIIPIYKATDPIVSREVATIILKAFIENFRYINQREPTPQDIYAIWNNGWMGYKKFGFDWNKLPNKKLDACERFNNLVEEYKKQYKLVE